MDGNGSRHGKPKTINAFLMEYCVFVILYRSFIVCCWLFWWVQDFLARICRMCDFVFARVVFVMCVVILVVSKWTTIFFYNVPLAVFIGRVTGFPCAHLQCVWFRVCARFFLVSCYLCCFCMDSNAFQTVPLAVLMGGGAGFPCAHLPYVYGKQCFSECAVGRF